MLQRVNRRSSQTKSRTLKIEFLEERRTMTTDLDDQLFEARPIAVRTSTPTIVSNVISTGDDVDMYRIDVASGQTVDIDIDTPVNGPGGLGAYIRLFDANGNQLAFNNDAAAPGESRVGFDSYLRYSFARTGSYFVGISNWQNRLYSATQGTNDVVGTQYATGAYSLSVQAMPIDTDDAMFEANYLGSISNATRSVNGQIDWDVDVDMYRVQVIAGQIVELDIDTPTNGPGGLGSYLRLFDSVGRQIAWNNDGAAPGERLGFDAYLRYQFNQGGTYYVGVSNWQNGIYNPTNGAGDAASWQHAIGPYQLNVKAIALQQASTVPLAFANSLPETVSKIQPQAQVPQVPTSTWQSNRFSNVKTPANFDWFVNSTKPSTKTSIDGKMTAKAHDVVLADYFQHNFNLWS